MKSKTVLLAIMTVVISTGSINAFADHPQTEISVAPGANLPGCETADECLVSSEVTVNVGGEVIWTNNAESNTTISSGNPDDGPDGMFDSGLLGPGESFTHTFDEPGEYSYFSMIHPWIQGVVIVQESGDHDEHSDEHGDEHSDEMMMPEGDATAMGMLSDGTMVSIWTSVPTAGEAMEISIEFKDAEHVNHDIMVTQNGDEVLHDEGAHHHEGTGMHMTAPLSSADPVDITITFQGYGIDEKTGPIGEEVVFTNVVPEFGTIAMMILAVAIISIVAVTAKSRVVPRF
ncbi:PEFG-CTERM sorting domain-containing protein [Nitrosopumilus maritimus]|uniref:Blue (Type 1) copper domain protein n=1 Tax=Nitrosopumilus maritimus (strain SCM1) TaxID=436308 RepID=A9A1J0_NITMS|nr:PEFG-CTERM sorting domain-containing protein [Nitrosopumilus maritimus]ABX13169.1 blue (type 1) copper domain protein [Nitrosopumilus maritimus SCM1]